MLHLRVDGPLSSKFFPCHIASLHCPPITLQNVWQRNVQMFICHLPYFTISPHYISNATFKKHYMISRPQEKGQVKRVTEGILWKSAVEYFSLALALATSWNLNSSYFFLWILGKMSTVPNWVRCKKTSFCLFSIGEKSLKASSTYVLWEIIQDFWINVPGFVLYIDGHSDLECSQCNDQSCAYHRGKKRVFLNASWLNICLHSSRSLGEFKLILTLNKELDFQVWFLKIFLRIHKVIKESYLLKGLWTMGKKQDRKQWVSKLHR